MADFAVGMEEEGIPFWKYHGAGNDLIMIDNTNGRFDRFRTNDELIRHLCARHLGVGADGLVEINRHANADFQMVFFRASGEQGTFGGNAGRCSVAFANFIGLTQNPEVTFAGSDGLHRARLDKAASKVELEFSDVKITAIERQDDRNFFVNTGSPHHVSFVDNVRDYDVIANGRDICRSERYKRFGGTNVNFVQVKEDGELCMRTFERGVQGEITACGTGAVAIAVVNSFRQDGDDVGQPRGNEVKVKVKSRTGELMVIFTRDESGGFINIWLVGPACQVYYGVFPVGKELLL